MVFSPFSFDTLWSSMIVVGAPRGAERHSLLGR
jgi:hypothetical protein